MSQSSPMVAIAPHHHAVMDIVVDSFISEHSRRAYRRAIADFLEWFAQTGQTRLDRHAVQAHVAYLRSLPMSPLNINARLVAIRKMARVAAFNDLLDDSLAQGIQLVEGEVVNDPTVGNWLTAAQVLDLVNAPNINTPKGMRDRAILATFIGTGLRREELSRLEVGHIQQREGRWIIADIVGKQNRKRSIPIASWNKAMIDAWMQVARPAPITDGRVFRAMNRHGQCTLATISDRAFHDIVVEHALAAGLVDEHDQPLVAPYDLRRTFAKLAYKGGSPLEQISFSLGHDSIESTQRFLGLEQHFDDTAPCDRLGVRLSGQLSEPYREGDWILPA